MIADHDRFLPVQSIPDALTGTGIPSPELAAWVPSLARESSRPTLRLLCFAHAGAGTSVFRSWQARMPSGVQITPVQLPGREHRWAEPPLEDLATLISTLAQVLRPLLDVPYALLGHSMGALIAFELARKLRQEGGSAPLHLFVSGASAPHLMARDSQLGQLPDDALIEELMRRFGQHPNLALQDAALQQVLLPVLRADLRLCGRHQPAPASPLATAITVYGGRTDPWVTYPDLVGWSLHTQGVFRLRLLSGGHFFLFQPGSPFLDLLHKDLGFATALIVARGT